MYHARHISRLSSSIINGKLFTKIGELVSSLRLSLLYLEVETFSDHTIIFLLVEPIQARCAVADVGFDLVKLLQNFHAEDFFPEVPLVQFLIQNLLVNALQATKGKLFRQQFKTNGLVGDLSTQTIMGHLQNDVVIEGQVRHVVDAEPGSISGIG